MPSQTFLWQALHPLLFNEDNKNYNEQILCFGWGEKVLMGPSYNCYQCDDFMLDKTYAELPHKIKNPFNGKRPLVPLKNLHLLLGYIAFVVSAENFALVLFMVVLIAGMNLTSSVLCCLASLSLKFTSTNTFTSWDLCHSLAMPEAMKVSMKMINLLSSALCASKVSQKLHVLPNTVKIAQHDHPLAHI